MSETVSTAAPSAPSSGSTGGVAQSSAPTPSQGAVGSTSGGGTAQGQASSAEKTPGTEAPAQPPAPAKRYLDDTFDDALVKHKIDGREVELTVKELKRLNSLEQASQKRMSEAAKERQQIAREREMARRDPEKFMKDVLGLDPKTWAEERLAREYELAQMSPEQRENIELKSRIEAQERMELESKKSLIDDIKKLGHVGDQDLTKFSKEDLANYREHLNNVNTQAQQSLQAEIVGAWEETKLPKHRTWGAWMAMEMMAHEKRTGEPLQAKEAAAKVKADWQKFNSHLFSQMDAPAIQEILGKEVVQKLIDHRVQGVTDQAATGFQQKQSPAQAVSDKKPYMNEIEYRAWLKQG